MTRSLFLMSLILCLAAASSTQPAPLELAANTAFNRGEYVTALGLYQKLRTELGDKSDKAGPIDEKIRVCNTQIAAAIKAGATTNPTTAPADGPRKPHDPPKAGEVRSLQIKELGNFEYDADKGGNIPADVIALSGSKVSIKGFMIPMDQAENVTQFALVPSLFACCFGQPPQIQHTIVCDAPKGKTVSYYPDELIVEGTLKVEEKKDEGFIVSIFEIEVSSVKPASK